MIWNLALRNLARRPGPSLLTVAGIALASGALFSLLTFQRSYKNGLQVELNQIGAHVLVVPKGCPYDAASMALHGANWPCYLKEAYLAQVAGTRGVAVAAPFFMAVSNPRPGERNIFVGITEEVLKLKNHWKIDGTFPRITGEALLGARLAESRGIALGALLQDAGFPAPLKVVGVLEPVQGPDDDFIYLRLSEAQDRFHHGAQLTHILVKLKDPSELEKVVDQLKGCDAGMQMNIVPLSHLFASIRKVVNSTRLLLGSIASIALIVAGTVLINTMFMAVAARTREIGMMRAIGASRAQIFRLYWLESAVVCGGGGVAGICGAMLFSAPLEAWIRGRLPQAPESSLLVFHPFLASACLVGVLVLGIAAGLAPAVRAARLSPMEAFRAQADF